MIRHALIGIALVALVVACDKGQTKTSPSVAHTCAELASCCAKVGDPGVKKQCLADQEKAKSNDEECAPLFYAYCP